MEKKRILAIDDEFSLLRLIQIILQRKGYDITAVLTSIEGRNSLKSKGPYDLIVLDLMMPNESGFDFLRWKDSEEEAIRRIPVIIITAKNLSQEDYDFLTPRIRKIVLKGMSYGDNLSKEVDNILGAGSPPPAQNPPPPAT